MRGRGRGRGGRGGRGISSTQDLIRDNFEDLGFDMFSQQAEFNTPPPLFPNIGIIPPPTLKEDDIYCIMKTRDITARLQISPYFLQNTTETEDIKRYSDKYKAMLSKNKSLLECINTCQNEPSKYIPLELLDSSKASKKTKKKELDLKKLEMAEKGETAEKKESSDNEDEDGEGENEQSDEFELDDDYGVDHYASDDGGGDEGDDDGGEATF